MAERPILFSDPMVKAILAGTKSQTRRVAANIPLDAESVYHVGPEHDRYWQCSANGKPYNFAARWTPGDLLWVRETWALEGDNVGDGYKPGSCKALYRADYHNKSVAWRWRPSIHMPRAASRITLRVTSVRVERLQEISEQDAAAEGVSKADVTGWISYRTSFPLLWDSINAERAPWASNPWVWVVAFERVLSGDSDA